MSSGLAPIHPTTLMSPDADLPPDRTVGPFAIFDGPVRLRPGSMFIAILPGDEEHGYLEHLAADDCPDSLEHP
jgi:hypothetical protein